MEFNNERSNYGNCFGTSLALGANVYAKNKNTYGLVYQGAITENIKGKINIVPTSYKLNGIKISANIYLPANYDKSKSYPAVVIAHPNGV